MTRLHAPVRAALLTGSRILIRSLILAAAAWSALPQSSVAKLEDILIGHVWVDQRPRDPDRWHEYHFFPTGPSRTGEYRAKSGDREVREHFEWEVSGGRIWYRFLRDDRKVAVPFKLEVSDGDGYVLVLAADPCRDASRRSYYSTTAGDSAHLPVVDAALRSGSP